MTARNSAYLERLAMQKFLFPEMTPRLEGFSIFEGHLYPVISQPHARDFEPTEPQVTEHLVRIGFVEVFETGKGMSQTHRLAVEAGLKPPPLEAPKRVGFYQPDTGIWLEDVHAENALVNEGRMEVFDPVTYFIDPVRFSAQAKPMI